MDRQTESDAYEPTVQNAQVGSKRGKDKSRKGANGNKMKGAGSTEYFDCFLEKNLLFVLITYRMRLEGYVSLP